MSSSRALPLASKRPSPMDSRYNFASACGTASLMISSTKSASVTTPSTPPCSSTTMARPCGRLRKLFSNATAFIVSGTNDGTSSRSV